MTITQRRPTCRKCKSMDVSLYEEIGATATFWDLAIDSSGDLVAYDNGTSDAPPRYIRSWLVCGRCDHRWRTRRSVRNEPA